MERKKASDFPQDLLNLFDRYVHGEIHRREFIDGAQKFAVGGMTATALFEMLRPNYAWAIQVPESDNRIKVESATIPSPKGNGTITGYMARPADATGKTARGFGDPREPRSQSVYQGRGAKVGRREIHGIGSRRFDVPGGIPRR